MECSWTMARPVARCIHRSLFRAANDAKKNVSSSTMQTIAVSRRPTTRVRHSTVIRFRLVLAGAGGGGASGGGGTAWMLVRPASDEVAGIGNEESFAEVMKA